jgi:Kef-type K+ transport system membrane component KefB
MTSSKTLLQRGANPRRTFMAYALMLVVAGLLYWLIRQQGSDLVAPASGGKVIHATSEHSHVLAEVLLSIATIVLSARLMGYLFDKYLKQPPVIGEIVAGLMLGPSVLGAISMPLYQFVLPPEAAPHLGIIAKIGVVLFMFLVGLELDLGMLRGTTHATMAISHASIVAPFLLGAGSALVLYPIYSHAGVSFTVFSLFLGVSMSVTAFPVLARILTDRRMQRTPLGTTALACAAVDDATAWCLLAFVSGVAASELQRPAITIGLVLVYLAVMYFVARPLAQWINARQENRSGQVTLTVQAMVLGMLLLSAVATEVIGIHALFGAFLFGALIPHEGRLAEMLRVRLDDMVVVLLLPIFFAFTGMRTEIGLLSSTTDWLLCGLVIVVATVGKFGGSYVAARLVGLSNRDSSALGILMNTRGLMELIVLNVGLDMGVLSPRLFAMFVLMALVTTFTTTPVLDWLSRRGDSFSELPAPVENGNRA